LQVLDDNAFDRMHSQGYSQQRRAAQQEQQQQLLPEPAGQEQAPAAAAAMDVDDADLPELEAPAAAATSQPAAAAAVAVTGGEQQQQQQQPAKRHKAGSGQVWVPPHRRPDYRWDNKSATVTAKLTGSIAVEDGVALCAVSLLDCAQSL
jgi:hypothetical protein